jgi:putative chitinase
MMLLCFISTTFWQCQKEEFETIDSTKQGKLNLWVVPGEKAFNESKKLRERVTSLKRKNTAARLTSTIYNFSIEEEHVQIIIGDDYTQYTFNVERENPTPNLLENYVCKIYTDGEVFQYLMGYPYSIGQNGISYQMQNSTIQVISDENIVVTTAGRGFPPGCVPEFLYEVLTYECTNYPCTGDGHTIHQSCDCDDITCNRAYTNCSWVTTAFYGGCGGDGGFTPPAGGGSTNPDTTTPTDPVVTVPFEPIVIDDDCNTSKEDLKKLFPNMPDAKAELLASIINDKGKDFGINTKEKLQHFLAQAGHETGGFNTLNVTENLNYSTASLIPKSYPSKFTMDTLTEPTKKYAGNYTGNPQALANVAMCCDFGNGNIASGDGWKYRGRGIFQLTWKNNYQAFKTWYNNKYNPDRDFVGNPDLVSSNDTIAILSGLWYYKSRVLDKMTVDSLATVDKVTKKINAARKGLKDRKERFAKAKDSIDCR